MKLEINKQHLYVEHVFIENDINKLINFGYYFKNILILFVK
jgi:hypothetical protein